MSASPIAADDRFLAIVVAASAAMFAVAVGLCAALIARRVARNRHLRRRAMRQAAFRRWLEHRVEADPETDRDLCDAPDCGPADAAEAVLHLLRTVGGTRAERLVSLTVECGLEQRLIRATRDGVRGARMCALRVLGYLDTQASLSCIAEWLDSRDSYVRLTAAHAMVRRRSHGHLNDVVRAFLQTFPSNHQGLGALLAGYGRYGTPRIEAMTRRADGPVAITAGLQALALLMPPRTALDLAALAAHADPRVRAAAIALSCVTQHDGPAEPVALGLRDADTGVRISAAKTACELRRADFLPALHDLTRDPSLWVRYWAYRAVGATGGTGTQFLATLSRTDPLAADVILETESGYV